MLNDIRNFIDSRYKSKMREHPAAMPERTEAISKVQATNFLGNINIAVCNQKGGCGKTTTVVNLSACLAERGYKVLLIDLDSQTHATRGLGINIENLEKSMYDVLMHNVHFESVICKTSFNNLDIAPASSLLSGAQLELADVLGRETVLRVALRKLKLMHNYDFIFLDCSPSLNLITINALVAANFVLIPIQTHYYSLEGMKELFSTIDIVKERLNFELEILGILPTLFDTRMKINHQVLAEIREYFKEKVFKTVIHNNVKLCEAPIYKKPIHIYAPKSRGAGDYWSLTDEVIALALGRYVMTDTKVTMPEGKQALSGREQEKEQAVPEKRPDTIKPEETNVATEQTI